MTRTYSYNGQELPLVELPKDLQEHIAIAEDFFIQLDAAQTPEEVKRVCDEHPHNQEFIIVEKRNVHS